MTDQHDFKTNPLKYVKSFMDSEKQIKVNSDRVM